MLPAATRRLQRRFGLAAAPQDGMHSKGEDRLVDFFLPEADVCSGRLDAPVAERALGLHEVAPETIVDPVREGLAHHVRAEVPRDPGCGERPPQDPPGVAPGEGTVDALAGAKEPRVGGDTAALS